MAYKFNPLTGQFDLVNPIPPGGAGDVTGPASATDSAIVLFDGTTGKVIKDSGVLLDDLANYSQSFIIADWVLSVDTYSLTVLKATHGKNSPMVVVYEISGTDFIKVETGVKIDASENIILTVNATPDLRFNGKLSIS